MKLSVRYCEAEEYGGDDAQSRRGGSRQEWLTSPRWSVKCRRMHTEHHSAPYSRGEYLGEVVMYLLILVSIAPRAR
jgi:hypothetical protein